MHSPPIPPSSYPVSPVNLVYLEEKAKLLIDDIDTLPQSLPENVFCSISLNLLRGKPDNEIDFPGMNLYQR